MKLRLLPVVITVVVSSVVLFGGWFGYHSVAMENPLTKIVDTSKGVESSNVSLTSDQVNIELKLKQDASLREIYQSISSEGASIIGKRKLQLDVSNASSPALDKWWSNALFEVAEAMETKQYADIPKGLQAHATEISGLQVVTEMDNKNVYIHLTDGDYSKFIILPRIPVQMGVWPNE